MVDGIVKGNEFAVGNNIYSRLFQFFLPKRAVVFQTVGVRSAADYFFAFLAKRLRFFALAEGVVENEDVRPVDIFFPIFGLGHKAVGNVALFLVADEVSDFVAFFGNLPGDVADQSGERYKQKILLLQRSPCVGKVCNCICPPPRVMSTPR